MAEAEKNLGGGGRDEEVEEVEREREETTPEDQ